MSSCVLKTCKNQSTAKKKDSDMTYQSYHRWILLISTCVLASAQDCGPRVLSCSDYFTGPVVGNPCWRISLNGDEKEYCHKGKNLTISTSDKENSAIVECDGEILDCSWLPTLNFAKGGQLNKLQFRNCGLNESISCVLRALDAKGLNSLFLYYWGTEITTETLRGLDGLKSFIVNESDAITKIPVEEFKQLPALQQIRISGTSINRIPAEAFTVLSGLNITFLEISRAKITELQSGAFQGLQGLINLSLFKNEITIVDKDAFKGLPLLDTLVLQHNPIADLPAGVFTHNPNLKTLDIVRNRAGLRLGKDTLAGLTKLSSLELTMYNESYRLSLEDQSLSGLPSLKYCDLSAAGLEELPVGLFKGTKALEELKLNDNELKLLPENVFEDLVNLKVLSLSKNKLQGELLNYSDVYKGPFSTTGKLETLDLARNNLQNISMQFFIGSSSLKILNLSYNKLNFDCRSISNLTNEGKLRQKVILSLSPLQALTELETLDLSHNSLTDLCNDFLVTMPLMQELNLSHNKIPALTWEDIIFLSKGVIDLRYNQITSIRPSFQLGNPTVTLLLGNNPFNCDCTNFRMLRELKNLKFDTTDAICSEPKSLEGVPLINITEAIGSYSLDNLTCVLPDTPKKCECIARPSKSMIECICNEVTNLPDPNNIANYSFIDKEITTKYNMLLKLKTHNENTHIPESVTNLSLTNLALETIPNIPNNISYVDLSYNKLYKIPYDLLSRNLTFNLNHNPFKCTCMGKTDIENLQLYKNKIYDYSSLKCHDGIPVEQVQVPHMCDYFNSLVIGITIAITIGILFALLAILAYKYQLELRIWLYNQGWTCGLFNYEKALDATKKYDIFLSYCHEDEDYVANELLPFMDPKYTVCVHTRDFIIGEDIMTQIYRAVADSRRTMIVASDAYFKSPWCLEEMRAAYKQTEVDQRMRAVVILRTDVDPKSEDISETVRSYLNLNTWISEKDPRFWYRLCYFLPRDVTVEDLRLIKVTTNAKKNLSGQLNKVFVHDGKFGVCETGGVNGNLARNLCGVKKDDVIDDEVEIAIKKLPGGLEAVCNNGKLAKNLPETLNVVHNEDEKLVNVAIE